MRSPLEVSYADMDKFLVEHARRLMNGNMLIKERNRQEFDVQLRVAGALSASANHVDAVLCPFAGFLKSIYAILGTAASTTVQADIQQNGTTISNSGNLLIFLTNTFPATPVLTSNPLAVSKGDVFTLSVPTVTGGTPKDLTIWMVFSKRPVAATEFQTISADFDLVD